jgi:CHAT domain-containing protein/lipopolysaccharide biosynthesis regulator YciM
MKVICLIASSLLIGLWVCAAPQSNFQELLDRGTTALKAREFPKAEQAFRSGFESAQAAGETIWAARFEQSLGDVYTNQGKYKDAEPRYQHALSVFEAARDTAGINSASLHMGRLYAALSDFKQAIPLLDRARAGFLQSKHHDDQYNAADALNVLGQIHARLGRFTEGAECLKQASAIYEAAGDAQRTAKVEGSLADLYSRHSDFSAALEHGFRALDVDEKSDDRRETAKVYDLLGNTFQKMGQIEKAISYYRRALELRETYKITQDIIYSYKNLGAALKDFKQYREALVFAEKSLELARRNGIQRDIAGNLFNIASIEEELDQKKEARQVLEESLRVAEQAGLIPEQSMGLYELGNLARSSHDLDRAFDLHQRALKLREASSESRDVVWSLDRLALVEEDRGNLEAAEQAQQRALDLFNKIGEGITDPVEYGAYRQTLADFYPHFARVLVKLGKPQEALQISERGRAVGLSRLARLDTSNFAEHLNAKDGEVWRDSGQNLAHAANELSAALQLPPGDPAQGHRLDLARASYLEKERELGYIRDRLFASTPALRSGSAIPAAGIEQLVSLAKLSPQSLFLEFVMVKQGSSIVFALSAGGLKALLLDSSAAEVRAAVDEWLANIERTRRRGVAIKPNAASESQELQSARKVYQLALAKVEPLLASGHYNRLVVAGEGPLLEIPFGALVDDQGRRLLDRYAISNTVSLSYLLREPTRRKPIKPMLAVGDPLGADEQRLVAPSGSVYEPLTYAVAEAKAVGAIYPNSLTLSGSAATETDVKRLLPQFRFLHFATHGVLDSHEGLRSGLLLATEPRDSSQDGILQAREIANMSLSAELAVLSACETGRGTERLDDGILGLAWAFQAAGVPRVVASLWSIDDAATRDLMTNFYRKIRAGSGVDEALRSASLQLRKDPRYSAPYYWAPFELIGLTAPLQ